MELTLNNMNTSCCCAIMAKAPVGRVPTNPSLKAGVSDGLIVRLSSRRSLNWALALTVPALQSVRSEPVEVSDDKLVQIIYCQSQWYRNSVSRRERNL